MPLSICVLYGSMREERLGIRAAKFIMNALKERGHHIHFIDAKEENLPLLDKRYMDYPAGQAPANLEKLATLYKATDAFVIIAGEYNYGIQPGLKNLLDYFFSEYAQRPAGIVSYSRGAFGGVRASAPLRITLSALGMAVIPKVHTMGGLQDLLDDSGKATNSKENERVEGFLKELEWYAHALKAARMTRN